MLNTRKTGLALTTCAAFLLSTSALACGDKMAAADDINLEVDTIVLAEADITPSELDVEAIKSDDELAVNDEAIDNSELALSDDDLDGTELAANDLDILVIEEAELVEITDNNNDELA